MSAQDLLGLNLLKLSALTSKLKNTDKHVLKLKLKNVVDATLKLL